jgi:hypothetical protein
MFFIKTYFSYLTKSFYRFPLELMPMYQILSTLFSIAIIAAVAYCVKGLGSVAIKKFFKAKRRSLADKRALAKDELEKRKLEFIEKTMNTAIECMKAVSLGIVHDK